MWKHSEITTALSGIDLATLLKNSLHGIERECLRIDNNGNLSQNSHPQSLGSKLTHPFITTDYAEAQLELVTNPHPKISSTFKELHDTHQFVYENMGEELLWPLSTACRLREANKIQVAHYGPSNLGKYKTLYRQGLKTRYKSKMQMLSGVHYNFSFSNEFWELLYNEFENHQTKTDFINRCYFSIIRNFNRYDWLLLYLFGATPAIDRSYLENKSNELIAFGKDSYCGEFATSLRMSDIGYTNNLRCCYSIPLSDISSFITGLRNATQTKSPEFSKIGLRRNGKYLQINENILQIENEYYAPIRPRKLQNSLYGKISDALEQGGVGHLEIRSLDVDPFSRIGVNEEQLQFIQLLLLYCLFKENPDISCDEQEEINANRNQVAYFGRKAECRLKKDKQKITLKEWGNIIIDEMMALLSDSSTCEAYLQLLKKQQKKIEETSLTPSALILEKMRGSKNNYLAFGLHLASKHKKEFLNQGLDKKKRIELETVAKNSIVNQKRLEETDNISFDEFMRENN
jgi:glutamate--cysteine ligase